MARVKERATRICRSQGEKKKMLDKYYESNETILSFSRRHNISSSTFGKWVRRDRAKSEIMNHATGSFIEISPVLAQGKESAECIEQNGWPDKSLRLVLGRDVVLELKWREA